MTDSRQSGPMPGFTPHVWNQLREISQSHPQSQSQAQSQPPPQQRPSQDWRSGYMQMPRDNRKRQMRPDSKFYGPREVDSHHSAPPPPTLQPFRPLASQAQVQAINTPVYDPNHGSVVSHRPLRGNDQESPREKRYQYYPPKHLQQTEQMPRNRPGWPQTRFPREQIYKQADYLHAVAKAANAEHKFDLEEFNVKENFRQNLEKVARKVLRVNCPDMDVTKVLLRCYGSIANGFALKNCDMDLMLSLPEYRDVAPAGVDLSSDEARERERQYKADVQRILEKAFLQEGYGARLLTQTRVPILKICQTPPPQLLENLRKERTKWESSVKDAVLKKLSPPSAQVPKFAPGELDPVVQAIIDMDITEEDADLESEQTAADETTNSIIAGGEELQEKTGLEFTSECGIQCDINFSNFVALENSLLLRTYARFDQRVKDLGTFVKIWAKARDINCPYRGTLSSYGYILMVIHYLMNVVQPPVIPNLQHAITYEDAWFPDRPVPLVDGFDVRFVQDPQGIKQLHEGMASTKNKESLGSLLRGFFMYYGTHQGFHWTRDLISIRTNGGILTKQSKGWTQAVWQRSENKSVRLRYIVAIEDPFETEHNVGRTVGHHGVIRIREEFRRAWGIVEQVCAAVPPRPNELILPVPAECHIDTLRRDLEDRKKRQMRMRLDLEIKEKGLLVAAETKDEEPGTPPGTCGDSLKRSSQSLSLTDGSRTSPGSKLTSSPSIQDQKPQRVWLPPEKWRHRGILIDSDDEDQAEKADTLIQKKKSADPVTSRSTPKAENSASIGKTTVRVPSTLYPGIDSSARPRDEDPNIMPIPRRLGVKFDPRQLEDLTVIAQGGNGCARDGAQFNIEEEEYEWGGGGMMGRKPAPKSNLSSSSRGPPSYQFGRGDHEGYLDELPALST